MPGFNPSAPNLVGGEWSPWSAPSVNLDAPGKAVIMRINPGAITPTALHVFLSNVVGNPGLCVELVDSITPTITNIYPNYTDFYYPGSDTNAEVTSWQDENSNTLASDSPNGFTHCDARSYTKYIRPNININAGSTLPVSFQGAKGLPANQRIAFLLANATIINTSFGSPPSAYLLPFTSDLVISSTRYSAPTGLALRNTWVDGLMAIWNVNPSQQAATGVQDPTWTWTAINRITNGTDRMGFSWGGFAQSGAALLASIYLTPIYCAENRHGYSHQFSTTPSIGWNRMPFYRVTSADGHTNSNASISAADGAFTQADVGAVITDTLGDIPANTTISAVTNSTTATISNAATGTHTTDIFTINTVGVNGIAAALSANTYYWAIITCPNGNASNYATVPAFNAYTALGITTSATGTGEHRQTGSGTPYGLAGPLTSSSFLSSTQAVYGLAALLEQSRTTSADGHTAGTTAISAADAAFTEADVGCVITDSLGNIPVSPVTTIASISSGTAATLSQAATGGTVTTDKFTIRSINTQSNPYAAIRKWSINASPHDDVTPVNTTLVNPGQTVTMPASGVLGGATASFGGIQLAYLWENLNVPPSQPLLININTNITGTGSTVATVTIPATIPQVFGFYPFDQGATTFSASTKYFVILTSSAASGAGWVVFVGDTRSDIATTGGSTLTAVEGASIGPTYDSSGNGGQTDSAFNNGAQLTRFDVGLTLVEAPPAPATLTGTSLAGVQ